MHSFEQYCTNPKNEDHYLDINTQSGNTTIDPHMLMVDELRNNVVDINDVLKAKTKK